MATVETSIEIQMPVRSVYNQWTQFEDFPEFMEGVESVTQLDDSRLYWVASVAGVRREWEAQITDQEPDKLISWRTTEGAMNAGTVIFESLEPMRTRITLRLEFDPEGFLEKAGDVLGIWQRRVENDLERFKTFLEERGAETGAWRGEIDGGRTVKLDEEQTIDAEGPSSISEFPQESAPRLPYR